MSYPPEQPVASSVRRLALFALVAFLGAIPVLTTYVRGWSGHDLARVAELPLMLLCTLAWLSGPPALSRRQFALVLSGAVLALATVTSAARPGMALRELGLFLGMAAIAACVARAREGGRRLAQAAVAAMALYAGAMLLVALAAVAASAAPNRAEMFAGYDNPRFFSHVLTAAMPVALAVRLDTRSGRIWRILADVALFTAGVLVFMAAGRATMLALAAGGFLALVCCGRAAWAPVGRLAMALVAGALAFAVLFLWLPEILHGRMAPLVDYAATRLTSDEARWYLWDLAWQQIRASPWLGVGPMHYAHMANAKAAHPHSILLQLAAEWGLPLTLMVLTAATAAMAALARRLRRAAPAMAQQGSGVALALGAVAVMVDGLASGNFVMPVSQVWVSLLFGLCWGWWREAAPAPEEPFRRPGRRAGALLLVAAVIVQGAAFVPALLEAPDLGRRMAENLRLHPAERTHPRFWSHGTF